VSLFSKSGVLHLKVGMLTGQINKDSKTLEHSDIIVSTARDWDIMSRRWRSRKGFQNIRLFVADDLHLLGENGSVLEVVVSRMRMISAQTKPIRIVGLCLSVADYRELGEWIGATPANTISFSPAARLNKVQILTFD
jgi:pre-mRNA-splicing helicase BRR2